jgi:hypothetical protein
MPKLNKPRHTTDVAGVEEWLTDAGLSLSDIKEIGHFEDGSMAIFTGSSVTVVEFDSETTTALAAYFRSNGLPIRRSP